MNNNKKRNAINIVGNDCIIHIHSKTHGSKDAIVDKEYYDLIKNLTWCMVKMGNHFYALTNINGKNHYLHRLIMDSPKLYCNHISDNKLDCRKLNLRLSNPYQSQATAKKKGRGKSKYIGVIYGRGKWLAQIKIKGKQIHIGTFDSEEKAAYAYDSMKRKEYGNNGEYNFPKEISLMSKIISMVIKILRIIEFKTM